MEKIIEFKNTNFAYNATNAFNDFSMEIEKGDIVTLIGTSGSGKTTLLEMLINKLPNDSIYYKGKNIKNCSIEELKKNIVVIFDSPITSSLVRDELIKYAKKAGIPSDEIQTRLDELVQLFDLQTVLENKPKDLSKEMESLIKILRFLIIEPAFLALDCMLANLKEVTKKKFFGYASAHDITVLNVTTDLRDSLYGNKLFVLDNFVLILEGSTLSILKTDTLLKRLGFKLPLPVDLSIELNHYDVLKKIYTKDEKLVNELWK